MRDLFEAGVFSKIAYGVHVFEHGAENLKQPLHLEVTDASQNAIDFLNSNGGSVTCVYKTKIQMQYHIKPYKYDLPMRETAMPPPHEALRMEERKKKGANVLYIRPGWLDTYKPIEVPEIPPHIRKPKPVVYKTINYIEK